MLMTSLDYSDVALPDAKERLQFGPEALVMPDGERTNGSVRLRVSNISRRSHGFRDTHAQFLCTTAEK